MIQNEFSLFERFGGDYRVRELVDRWFENTSDLDQEFFEKDSSWYNLRKEKYV